MAGVVSALEDALLFQLRALKLPEPVRELAFAKPRRWRFDFAWPDAMLACEVEGGVWSGGRHTRGAGFEADAEKYATALLLGWRVLKVTGKQVASGQAIDWLEQALRPKEQTA